ncbi:MAG: hypothetical protein R3E57_08175 [Porticoccaceae bacterium]
MLPVSVVENQLVLAMADPTIVRRAGGEVAPGLVVEQALDNFAAIQQALGIEQLL